MSHKTRPAYLKAVARETKSPAFSHEEWAEIYYAVARKASDLENGYYGSSDSETNVEEWAAQLRSIMARIEAAGINV